MTYLLYLRLQFAGAQVVIWQCVCGKTRVRQPVAVSGVQTAARKGICVYLTRIVDPVKEKRGYTIRQKKLQIIFLYAC